MDPWVYLFLLPAAFLAAFIDSIVGGGGAISLPAILAVGIPTPHALGTNKLAATGASLMATIRFTQAGAVIVGLACALVPFSIVGSLLGSHAVQGVARDHVIAWVLVAMGLITTYALVRPQFGSEDRFRGVTFLRFVLNAFFALLIGFYDGFLGPGTGSFLLFAFVGIQQFNFVRAAGHARVLNFASNLASLAYFFLQGQIIYEVGLPMLAAMLLGGHVGSRFALKHGAKWIRPLFVLVTLALMVRLALVLAGKA